LVKRRKRSPESPLHDDDSGHRPHHHLLPRHDGRHALTALSAQVDSGGPGCVDRSLRAHPHAADEEIHPNSSTDIFDLDLKLALGSVPHPHRLTTRAR
jgi:hypothetical protein